MDDWLLHLGGPGVREVISVFGGLQRIVERAGISPHEFAELVRQIESPEN